MPFTASDKRRLVVKKGLDYRGQGCIIPAITTARTITIAVTATITVITTIIIVRSLL